LQEGRAEKENKRCQIKPEMEEVKGLKKSNKTVTDTKKRQRVKKRHKLIENAKNNKTNRKRQLK
jgi:hypothetical protein